MDKRYSIISVLRLSQKESQTKKKGAKRVRISLESPRATERLI